METRVTEMTWNETEMPENAQSQMENSQIPLLLSNKILKSFPFIQNIVLNEKIWLMNKNCLYDANLVCDV